MSRLKMSLGILIIIFALPIVSSLTKPAGVGPGSANNYTAYAGHTTIGGWCECGAPGCLCDPGEEMTAHSVALAPDSPKAPKPGRGSELEFGSAALLIGLAFLVWTRMRA